MVLNIPADPALAPVFLIQADPFMEEEFEEARGMVVEGINNAINDDTVGIRKSILDRVDKIVDDNMPGLLTPVKESMTESSPSSAPIINASLDTCVTPTTKKVAKYSAGKCVDKCVQPQLGNSVGYSTNVGKRSTQYSMQSTTSLWTRTYSWIASFYPGR